VNELTVSLVGAGDVRPLRHAVLRGPQRPLCESVYPVDDDAATVHLGAFVAEQLVGCATVFPEPLDGEPAWRLRGMAVHPARRSQGVGSRLLTECLRTVQDQRGRLLWCNARTQALSFYRGHGFTVAGEEFLTAGGVPHYLALLRLVQPDD
jgi:predicted GNAT family N-acyltransferase